MRVDVGHLVRTFLVPLAPAGAARGAVRELTYNRDVRPVLADACFKCHGFDRAARKADLRLDVREDAVTARGGAKVVAIVPGDPGASEVWRRITSDDPDERMPPASAHVVLHEAQKATIRAWIEQGA